MLILADHLDRFINGKNVAGDDLNNLLNDDISSNVKSRDVVALCDLLRGVKAVLWEEVIDVKEVEDQRDNPVDDNGGDDGEPNIGKPGNEIWLGNEGIVWYRRQAGVEHGVVCHDADGWSGFVDHYGVPNLNVGSGGSGSQGRSKGADGSAQ